MEYVTCIEQREMRARIQPVNIRGKRPFGKI
jgi:hypothetical protein